MNSCCRRVGLKALVGVVLRLAPSVVALLRVVVGATGRDAAEMVGVLAGKEFWLKEPLSTWAMSREVK